MTEKKPTLCVVAGPNGSGKTTTTVQLLNNEWTADSLYINPEWAGMLLENSEKRSDLHRPLPQLKD